MTLVEFLKARLDEDAWNNRIDPKESWQVEHNDDAVSPSRVAFPPSRVVGRGHYLLWDAPESIAAHIARHDPRRVAADVEAKRRLIEQHTGYYGGGDDEFWPVQTLRLLALPYSDHPDYQEEWRP
ncbi:DUF6221 family protein [Actinomadura rugatobispora]|uniref:DUF6221 family protein n=1 Tax=Actinomadura rugatobispora TaxID=1994 RepID=A0ABW0ZNH8_9ACTN|nr:hypothetical protein GCM10010200_036690 [Actinomadura rugatobispora]